MQIKIIRLRLNAFKNGKRIKFRCIKKRYLLLFIILWILWKFFIKNERKNEQTNWIIFIINKLKGNITKLIL